VVVILAFSRDFSSRFEPHKARKSNKNIIKNIIQSARPEASKIYFSSIAVFADSVNFNRFDWYTQMKKYCERVFKKHCTSNGYIFRIGNVVGPRLAQNIKEPLNNRDTVRVDVPPKKKSNIVHTVTIADAINTVSNARQDKSISKYTIVNCPQWTWRKTLSFYSDDSTIIRFTPKKESDESNKNYLYTLFGTLWNLIRHRQRTLRYIATHLPTSVNKRIYAMYRQSETNKEINKFQSSDEIELGGLKQDKAPGERIDQLQNTESLLHIYNGIDKYYNKDSV
jgi:hypothetical protein